MQQASIQAVLVKGPNATQTRCFFTSVGQNHRTDPGRMVRLSGPKRPGVDPKGCHQTQY